MRRPRVVMFNYNWYCELDLMTFFQNRGYDTFIVMESVTCPIYGKKGNETCLLSVPCCDIMVVIQDVEQGQSVDLFTRQFLLGCKLTFRNKAIITRALSLVGDRFNDIAAMGIPIFGKPLNFNAFESWVKDCETRMDRTQRLAIIRRADRYDSSTHVKFRLSHDDVDLDAQTVNISSCGLCLKTSSMLKREQVLHFVEQRQAGGTEEGIVQWAKKLDNDWYLVGVTFCL